ncbi:hypothetical protein G6F16_001722 [Rhizopus arrhizus]|nr:hypothetical protein G6F16_001722 [Rhizopus arrhizus]
MIDTAENAQKEFNERLDPSTDFYKKYTIYWGKRDAEAIVVGMKLLSVSKSVEKEQISKSGLEKIIESAENFADNRLAKCSILDMEHKAVQDMLKSKFTNYNELRRMKELPEYTGTALYQQLLCLIEACGPTPSEIDKSLRTKIDYPEEFFSAKDLDFLAAEGVVRHFLGLMMSETNPLSTLLDERTCAAWSIIPVINHLIYAYLSYVDVKWIEPTHHQTNRTKWDGIICTKNTDDIVCLMEFAGGNTPKDEMNHKKQNNDELKLYNGISRLSKQIDTCSPQFRIFVIRTIGSKAYFESVSIKCGVLIRTRHFVLEWPKNASELHEFTKQLPKLMSFRLALFEAIESFSKITKEA